MAGAEETERKHTISKEDHGVYFSKNCHLDSVAAENFTFSGTDNGVKTMSTTVGFSLDRFKYHLDLYHQKEGKIHLEKRNLLASKLNPNQDEFRRCRYLFFSILFTYKVGKS